MYNNLLNRAAEIKASGSKIKVLKCRFAEINTEIECLYGHSFYGFKQYLNDFDKPDIVISISQDEIDKEKKMHPELAEPEIYVECDRVAVTYDYGFLEPQIAMKKMADAVIPFNTLLMHGAVVAKDRYAYAFIAPSGVGKSTRAQIWLNEFPDSFIVNGDKPFIKITENEVLACGSPWSGKEGWNTNAIVPLRAMFFIERTEKTITVEEISIGKAFPFLIQATHQPLKPELILQTITLLKKLEGKVKFYKFCSPPTPEAIRLAYETARPYQSFF